MLRATFVIFLLSSSAAFAQDASQIIQRELSARIGEEMNKAIGCEVKADSQAALIRQWDAESDAEQDAAD